MSDPDDVSVAVLSDNRILVVHDDGRSLGRTTVTDPESQFSKAANQAGYSLSLAGSVPETRIPKNAPVFGSALPESSVHTRPNHNHNGWFMILGLALLFWLKRPRY